MSDENPFDETTEAADGFVEVRIKGGPYNNQEFAVRRPTTPELEKELAALIKVTVGAKKSLDDAIKSAEGQPSAPAPGTYGKPSGADNSTGTDLPFADSGTNTESESKVPTCQHGTRKASLYQGKTYYACASDLPRGDPGRCAVVEGS